MSVRITSCVDNNTIRALDRDLFNGPNDNANEGRRNSLANRACLAAKEIAAGQIPAAIAHLESLLDKIDGLDSEPDWLHDSPEKTSLAAELNLLIGLLQQ